MHKKAKSTNLKKVKIIGFIPSRMVAFRFPNKPLKKILGIPMIEHAYERSKLFKNWQNLYLTTPDSQIKNFCKKKIPVIMTSKKQKDKYLTKF